MLSNKQSIVICLLILLSTLLIPCFAINKQTVTVRLFEAHRPLRSLKLYPPFEIVGPDINTKITFPVLATVQENKICLNKITPERTAIARSSSFLIRGINSGLITVASPSSQRRYCGTIILLPDKDNSLNIVNRVPVIDYIKGVVASESPVGACPEMLKAQAVLCQTLLDHQKSSNIIGDSTQSQCYLGASLERPATSNAVDSVKGKMLYYNGLPIKVYFHSTCAGGTSNGAQYFRLPAQTAPYLHAVICNHCCHSPFWSPTQRQMCGPVFAKVFGTGLPQIVKQDYTGRPLLLKLASGRIMSGYDFWIKLGQNFGWDKCPGTRYKLKQTVNGNIIIESTGAGHGIGLCQWGANELAKEGKTYQQILQYYFPGCELR